METRERGGETRLIDVRRERVLAGALPEWDEPELESELGERGGRGREPIPFPCAALIPSPANILRSLARERRRASPNSSPGGTPIASPLARPTERTRVARAVPPESKSGLLSRTLRARRCPAPAPARGFGRGVVVALVGSRPRALTCGNPTVPRVGERSSSVEERESGSARPRKQLLRPFERNLEGNPAPQVWSQLSISPSRALAQNPATYLRRVPKSPS